ncbi:hypothetical protein V6N13_010545 [Hibiscus sabdariffa]
MNPERIGLYRRPCFLLFSIFPGLVDPNFSTQSELESPFTNSRSVIYKARFHSSKICVHHQNVAAFGTQLGRDSVIKV